MNLNIVKMAVGCCLGVGLALAVSTVAPAFEREHSAEETGPELGAELDTKGRDEALKVSTESPFVDQLIRNHGGSFGDWESAEIEGEVRGAYAVLTLDTPVEGKVLGLRPDQRALLGADDDHDHDHDHEHRTGVEPVDVDRWYPLEEVVLDAGGPVEAYVVVVDLPTRSVISVMPWRSPPSEAAPAPRNYDEELLPNNGVPAIETSNDEIKGGS